MPKSVASPAKRIEFHTGSGALLKTRARLLSDQLPQRITGPLVSVKAAIKMTSRGNTEMAMTPITLKVKMAAEPERTRTGRGARPSVMV